MVLFVVRLVTRLFLIQIYGYFLTLVTNVTSISHFFFAAPLTTPTRTRRYPVPFSG